MPTNNKRIRDRVTRMNNAWREGAPTVTFKGITQTAFQTAITSAAAIEQEIAALESQTNMKKSERDAAYQKLNDDSIKVRDGVEGNESFGTNHPLYEAMGFKLESNRKSGLTRKKKTPPPATS
jgi:hypothetical protein